jgi:hypothetical protein
LVLVLGLDDELTALSVVGLALPATPEFDLEAAKVRLVFGAANESLLLKLFRDDDVMNGVRVRLFMDIAAAGSKLRTMAVCFDYAERIRNGKSFGIK